MPNISISCYVHYEGAKWEVAWFLRHGKAHRGLIPQILSFITQYTEAFFFPKKYMPTWGNREDKTDSDRSQKWWVKKTSSREFWIVVWKVRSLRVEKKVNQEELRYKEAVDSSHTLPQRAGCKPQKRASYRCLGSQGHVGATGPRPTRRGNLNIRGGQ